MPHTIYLALGTNLGDRLSNLRAALDSLAPDVRVTAESRIYETEPWGYTAQPSFLNMVICAETQLSPESLLSFLKKREDELGRTPSFRYGPRQIDMDILFYDALVLATPSLVIPHPRLPERAFVLVPLAEIASDLIHPVLGVSVAALLETVDRRGVSLFDSGSEPPGL